MLGRILLFWLLQYFADRTCFVFNLPLAKRTRSSWLQRPLPAQAAAIAPELTGNDLAALAWSLARLEVKPEDSWLDVLFPIWDDFLVFEACALYRFNIP